MHNLKNPDKCNLFYMYINAVDSVYLASYTNNFGGTK
jgi:hypothetical protein